MDNLLRLDLVLGDLFAALDQEVGQGNYVVGFTGDHGVMNNPERIDGGGLRLTEEHRTELGEVLGAAARRAGLRPDLSTAQAMLEALETLDFVGPAYTQEALGGSIPGDSIAALFQHSFTPGRPGGLLSTYGVEMWWTENTLAWGMPVGTTHGSPFHYDRWVPLILMGPGVEPGKVDERVRPMDLAPTLAALAGIPYPDDLDGRPLISGGD
jgi:arylsulfatase A-like enzyme